MFAVGLWIQYFQNIFPRWTDELLSETPVFASASRPHGRSLSLAVTKTSECINVFLPTSGPSAKASEEDQERTRRLADAEMHRHHLESLLDQRDREISALREVMSGPAKGNKTLHVIGLVMLFVPFIQWYETALWHLIWSSRSCTVDMREPLSPPKLRLYRLSSTWRWELESGCVVCRVFAHTCHAVGVNSSLSTPGCKNQFNGAGPERHGRGAANAEIQWTPELRRAPGGDEADGGLPQPH